MAEEREHALAERIATGTARLPRVMRKSPHPTSAVNWPALLVLWAIALVFVLLGR